MDDILVETTLSATSAETDDDETPQETSVKPDSEVAKEEILFDPPLYKQRYLKVCALVERLKCEKIVDFGCAECKLVRALRNLETPKEIIGVDIDRSLLEDSKLFLQPGAPNFAQPRSSPLCISTMEGNLIDHDARFHDTDLVLMVEIIEHLYDETLSRVPEAIFGKLSPKHVFVSTPNFEFNICFGNEDRELKFRHIDHKFEWTRAEFRKWCEDISSTYHFSVEYIDLGDPPASFKDVGPCTQAALFSRSNDSSSPPCACDEKPYKEVARFEYPFRSRLEKLNNEVAYHLNNLKLRAQQAMEEQWEDAAESKLDVEISSILSHYSISKLDPTEDEIRTIIQALDCYQLSDSSVCIDITAVEDDDSQEDDDDMLDYEVEMENFPIPDNAAAPDDEIWEIEDRDPDDFWEPGIAEYRTTVFPSRSDSSNSICSMPSDHQFSDAESDHVK